MNSEDRFKKSLEELLASKEFPFDEANWDKAQQMLGGSRKPRRAFLYLISGILLVGLLSTSIYLFSNVFSTSPQPLAIKSSEEIKVPEPFKTPEPTAEKETIVLEPTAAAAKKVAKVIEKSTPPNEKNKPSGSIKSTKQEAKKFGNEGSEKVDTPKPAIKVTEPAITGSGVLAETSPNSNDVKGDSDTIENETTYVNNDSKKVQEPKMNVVADKTTVPPVNNSEESAATTEETATIPIAANTNNAGAIVPDATNENEKTAGENFASDVLLPLVNENKLQDEKSTNEEGEGTTVAIEDSVISTASIVPASKIDTPKNSESSVNEIPADNDQGELGKPKDYPVVFSVEAGASYLFGWQNNGTLDANGFNPVIGLNYFNNFLPKMSLTFGLHYSSVNNLSYSNYTSKVTRLGFGEETKVTVFTPVKVHYLIVPLRFNYNLTPLNTVGIGCNIAYLLNIESEVENYTEKLNSKYNQTLSKTTGYTEGFKQYDTQLALFYKRRLYPNLSLNLEVFYGLTDIKDNTFFKSNVFERNNGMKLTLVYNFIKR